MSYSWYFLKLFFILLLVASFPNYSSGLIWVFGLCLCLANLISWINDTHNLKCNRMLLRQSPNQLFKTHHPNSITVIITVAQWRFLRHCQHCSLMKCITVPGTSLMWKLKMCTVFFLTGNDLLKWVIDIWCWSWYEHFFLIKRRCSSFQLFINYGKNVVTLH